MVGRKQAIIREEKECEPTKGKKNYFERTEGREIVCKEWEQDI